MRYFIFSTTDPANCSSVRTVILRGFHAGERTLDIYTDGRSGKIAHLRRKPATSLLFYDPRKKVQIRLRATARIHHEDETAAAIWRQLPVSARKDYCAHTGPGTPLDGPGDGLPPSWQDDDLQPEDTDYGFAHFALIRCQFDHVDLLQLDRDGHRRAIYHWNEERWDGQWVVP